MSECRRCREGDPHSARSHALKRLLTLVADGVDPHRLTWAEVKNASNRVVAGTVGTTA